MSHHIPDAGKMVSARDVLAASLWLIDREIAGAPLPHPSWETFRENDPETAMIYETQAGCHLAALAAAGWVVVPREPTAASICAAARLDWDAQIDPTWRRNLPRHDRRRSPRRPAGGSR